VSDASYETAQHRLGVRFADPALLRRALTHPSWSLEQGGEDYERLEFLGDSVLGFIVAEHLHGAFPHLAEGDLTVMKIALVSGRTLSAVGAALGLAEEVRLGRGAARDGVRDSVLEAVFEAVVGAVYLDAGLDTARDFVLGALGDRIDPEVLMACAADPKSELQEHTQRLGLGLPTYHITGHEGPAHDRRFAAQVMVADRVLGAGEGHSKQSAQQAAARSALDALR
jgi:ribonuclease-3